LQPGAFEIAIIGVGGTVVGTLLGAWLSYHFGSKLVETTHNNNISMMQRKDFNEAATKFRVAFKDELLALNPALAKGAPDACDLLAAAFEKHRSAVFDFKPYLRPTDAEGLEQAWQKYYRYPDAPDCTVPIFNQYAGEKMRLPYKEAKQRKLDAAERIEEMLSFAHYK
jgi:hypothetical protein